MADQIIIRGENPETTNIFEESPQIVNVIESNNSEVRIFEEGSESINVQGDSIIVNVIESEDRVIQIFEPGIRGATGPTGSTGSGSASIPDGTISGSSQVIYSQITGVPGNLFSSSQQVNFSQISGSFSTGSFLQNSFTASFNSFSSSIEAKVQRLESVTSSFAVKTEISGAFTSTSASLAGRIAVYDSKTLFSSSAQLPSGLISSSNGFFSSSGQVDYNSIQNQPNSILSASYALTASYVSGSNSSSVSASYAVSSSYSNFALSASYAPSSPSVSSSFASTASFATNIQTIGIRIKTEDTYIVEGSKGYKHIGYNSNIIKLRSIANIAGNININVKREGLLLGNYQLSNQSSSLDTSLTNWTSSLNTNDMIEFYVSQSSTYITDITFFMDLQNR